MKLFDTEGGRDVAALSFPEFMDWRDRGSEVFESIGAYGARGEVLSGAGEAEQLLGVQASLEVPGLLGLRPILGRGFVEADEQPGFTRRRARRTPVAESFRRIRRSSAEPSR